MLKTDDNSNIVTKSPWSDSPGPLRGGFKLTIHTREALKLVEGRPVKKHDPLERPQKAEYIMGLKSFGQRMSGIWIAAQYDDPYADWYLLQVEETLAEAKAILTDKKQQLRQLLDSNDSVKINLSHSINPIEMELNFGNPYGYHGALLVAEFDAMACAVMTAWHVGFIDRTPKRDLIISSVRRIRRAFLLSTRWQFTGATRDSINDGKMISDDARRKMGELPEDLLSGKLRAKLAPEIRKQQTFSLPQGQSLKVASERLYPGMPGRKIEQEKTETGVAKNILAH